MKDMPAALPAGFAIAAALERGDARDAFVSPRHASLAALPRGRARRHLEPAPRSASCAIAGLTSRSSSCAATWTRASRKLDAGECDATVLAAAGLERLGLESRIRARLAPARNAARDRPGHHRHRMRCRGARTSSSSSVRSSTSRRGRCSPPSARSRRRSARAASPRSPGTRRSMAMSCGSTGSSARPTERTILVDTIEGAARDATRHSAPQLAEKLLAAGAGRFL